MNPNRSYAEERPVDEEPETEQPEQESFSPEKDTPSSEESGDEYPDDVKEYFNSHGKWAGMEKDGSPAFPNGENYTYKIIRDKDNRCEYWIVDPKLIKEFQKYLWWKQKLPANECDGRKFTERMLVYLRKSEGKFIRDEMGGYHIVLDGRSIPLNATSIELAALIVNVCDITSKTAVGGIVVQRLQVEAHRNCSDIVLRRFSASVNDENEPRIYIPTAAEGKLLRIGSKECRLCPNGNNEDHLWLEHPMHDPLKWTGETKVENISPALRRFEELLVDTQACTSEAMRWFVAMHEGLFPYVRDFVLYRFIVSHQGPSGAGKTTGGKRFTTLHGIGDVLGDVTTASLGNMPEQGLIVLDNKEQANFTQDLIDYCLFLATGATRMRSGQDGTNRRAAARPVGVITSIEGVRKSELHARCVVVDYAVRGDFMSSEKIESAIRRERHEILSALAIVLREYLFARIDPEVHIGVNPISRFEDHFRELCFLLIAYGRVTGRPGKWAEEIIHEWSRVIGDSRDTSESSSTLESPILRVLREKSGDDSLVTKYTSFTFTDPVTSQTRSGTLWKTTSSDMIEMLRAIPGLEYPTEPAAFGRRLRTERFQRFVVLDGDSGITELQRKGGVRYIGFFEPGEPVHTGG